MTTEKFSVRMRDHMTVLRQGMVESLEGTMVCNNPVWPKEATATDGKPIFFPFSASIENGSAEYQSVKTIAAHVPSENPVIAIGVFSRAMGFKTTGEQECVKHKIKKNK